MKILTMPQGSDSWLRARMGIPTASEFDSILTPKKLGRSASSEKYAARLLAEWTIGHPIITDASQFMERGKEQEPQARAAYAWERGVDVRQVGLCLRDDGLVACSPDGLVGDDGGLELKIPSIEQHVLYYLNPQKLVDEYHGQIQGNLYVTGRDWWDAASWNSDLGLVVVRIEPDPDYQAAIGPALDDFVSTLMSLRLRLQPLKDEIDARAAAVQRELREQEEARAA
jgi:hypothetical protein